jgi:hypothetical protein
MIWAPTPSVAPDSPSTPAGSSSSVIPPSMLPLSTPPLIHHSFVIVQGSDIGTGR